jgi:PAS domain S-box-containing protein
MRDDAKPADPQAADVQAHLSAIVEGAGMRFSVEFRRFSLVTFNASFARAVRKTFGVELRAGMTPEEVLPPEAAAQWRAFFERALGEAPYRVEYEVAQNRVRLTFERLVRGHALLGIAVAVARMTDGSRSRETIAVMQARVLELARNTRELVVSIEDQRRVPAVHAITDRVALEAAAAPVGLRALVQDWPVAIGVARRLHMEYVNAAYAEILHTTAESLTGRPIVDHWVPECRSGLAALIGNPSELAPASEYEGHGLRPDGSVFPAKVTVRLLSGASGEGVIVFLTDKTAHRAMETQLHQTLDELRRLRDHLERDNLELRQQITIQQGPSTILGQSAAILQVIEQARAVAPTDSVVLITGETGTGKELLARAIHEMSPRAGRPLVSVNCAALPSGLVESELFGREKGAFTDASSRQSGRFESADGSTLFLDEVAELPLEAQAKLLRVLEGGHFERLGSAQEVRVDVRVIAATNRDLAAMVEEQRFRADLFYRLRVFPIEVPSLRARPEDIPLLARDAVRFFSKRLGKAIDSISWETMQQLQRHAWPGNVRELRNVIERAVILSSGSTLSVALDSSGTESSPVVTLFDAQRRHILTILESTGWRVGGRNGAAARLDVRRSTLNSMIKRLGIARPVTS